MSNDLVTELVGGLLDGMFAFTLVSELVISRQIARSIDLASWLPRHTCRPPPPKAM